MGSVYPYTTQGGERCYRILYRHPHNTQTSERGFTRKRDAELRLAEVEVGKAKGDYVNPTDGHTTVHAHGGDWLRSQKTVLKPSSYLSFETAWRVHVAPRGAPAK